MRKLLFPGSLIVLMLIYGHSCEPTQGGSNNPPPAKKQPSKVSSPAKSKSSSDTKKDDKGGKVIIHSGPNPAKLDSIKKSKQKNKK